MLAMIRYACELIKSLTGVDLLALAQQFGEAKPVPAASGDGAPPTLLEPPTEDIEAG